MKKMKKLASLVLALAMALTLAVPAMAAGPFTVTIENADGHTYQIYQIFTGDLAEKDGKDVLSNIKYGADYTPGEVKVGDTVPEEVLKNFNQTNIQPTGNGTAMTTSGDTATAQILAPGYYMIKDVTTNLPAGHTPSDVIFQVVGDTTVYSKHSGTTIEKKIKDINDSTGEVTKDNNGGEWIDSADYDIGDSVPFRVVYNVDSLPNYNTYKVVFTDTMSKGLTFNQNSLKIMYGNTDVTNYFTVSAPSDAGNDPGYTGGKVYTFTCGNIKAFTGDAVAAELVLTYSATLNENAEFGAPGNPNKIKVSNKYDGTGETAEDAVIAFTYKVVVNKFNEKNERLPGAEFTLEKFVANGEGTETCNGVKGNWSSISKEETEPGTTFTFKGLDDGNYRLTETETPAGYNTIDPVYFTVTADHDIVWETQLRTDVLNTLTGDVPSGEIEFTETVSDGSLSADVVNQSGATLPETGGMGTTLFYALGAVLVIGAGVAMVTKKRMG